MDKLTAIKIKYDDGTYSDEIPVSVLSENVEWDSTHTLVDVLGSIDVDVTGTIQDQISQLFNEKISAAQLQNYVTSQLNEDVSTWLNNNVDPVGSAVIVDSSLTISGAAADAKKTGDEISDLKSALDNKADAFSSVDFSVTGKRITIDGTLVSSDACSCTDFYECSEGTKIEIYGTSFYYQDHAVMLMISFYNNDKSLIPSSGISQINGSSAITSQTGIASTVAPINCAYVRFSTRTVDGMYAHVFNFFGNDIKTANDGVKTLNSLVISGNDQNLFSNRNAYVGYLNTSGALADTSNPNNHTTDYFEVAGKKAVTVQTWMTLPTGITQWQAICYYDANKSIIGNRLVNNSSSIGYQKTTWEVPNNAVYARVSSRTYNDWKIMLQYGDTASAFVWNQSDIEYFSRYESEIVTNRRNFIASTSNIKGIAHRGSDVAPENTMAAFMYALNHNYKYIETDIAFTSDGVAVLLHDDTINRTGRNADGSEISGTVHIYDITYAQAYEYDFGIWKGTQYAGEKIPTLAGFLEFCRKCGIHPYLEVKINENYESSWISSAIDMIYKYGIEDASTVISFSYSALETIHASHPNLRLGFVTSTIAATDVSKASALKGNNEVFIDCYTFDDTLIDDCINAGIHVEMYGIASSNTIINTNPFISGMTTDDNEPCNVLYESGIN